MKITFLGATGTVTGSSYLVETDTARFLVDCGMFQGSSELNERNYAPFDIDPKSIDFILLTHAHIDHSGLLPKIVKLGFQGKIYATKATVDLCGIMLPDSAHIQEEELIWRNRKRLRAGKALFDPLYTQEDVAETMKYFQKVPYREEIPLSATISATFYDAGHILGSSFIHLHVTENDKVIRITFSGDLGNRGQRIVKDPDYLPPSDYVFLESTYGSRYHRSREETVQEFREIIKQTITSKGNSVIPAFAVERTQEILYELHEFIQEEGNFSVPIFIDSPLAIDATDIFKKHEECFDREMWEYVVSNSDPFENKNTHYTRTIEESKNINLFERAIIISASGMCDAGRIKHHLKHNLWKEDSHIIFVGYQAKGSLGDQIINGAKVVKILGEEIAVKAHIHTLGGFSGHADQRELLHWLGTTTTQPKKIFLVHGDDEAREVLGNAIQQQKNVATYIPKWKERVELS